jgi:anti-sigma factor RsiW
MNVTKDVVRDLIVVYLAGDASSDTRQLVEEWVARDPELAETINAARSFSVPTAAAPANLELRALDRTKRLLSRKHSLLGFSLFLTYAPLSFAFDAHRSVTTFVMFRDRPGLAGALLFLGLQGWLAFLYTCRQLQVTGLEPTRSWRSRLVWALGGLAVGLPVMICLGAWTGWSPSLYFIGVWSGIALWAGEKLGQVATPDVLHRPTTIFGSEK